MSANGAIYPLGLVGGAVVHGALRWDGLGFQPLLCLPPVTWGPAPGWFKDAPLALTEVW